MTRTGLMPRCEPVALQFVIADRIYLFSSQAGIFDVTKFQHHIGSLRKCLNAGTGEGVRNACILASPAKGCYYIKVLVVRYVIFDTQKHVPELLDRFVR